MSTGTRGRHGHASKVDREAATKQTTVEFVAKQSDEQVVTGVVMSPMSVDRQGDYETPETVESFADQFESLYANGDADGGVMHAAWPSEWMELVANGIAGKTFPPDAPIPDDIDTMSACIDWAESETDVEDPAAFCQSHNVEEDIEDGMWVQTWRVHDDGLWNLIDDGVIEGFSIGARDVSWRGPMEQADLPEGVSVPEEYPEDEPVWELEDGIICEVSAVDTPAVPEAMILAKEDAEKALDEYLGDREGFMQEAQERGHSEDEADALWDVLSRAAQVDGADSPGKESLYERIGKAAAKALPGVSAPEATDDATGAEHQTRMDTAKEGRTLSRANRESAKAAIDANLDLLEDAGVEHGMTRFTDREDDAFDLSEHSARTWANPDDDTDPEDEPDDDDDDTTESMTDTDDNPDDPDKSGDPGGDGGSDPFNEAPAWAKSLKDAVEENSDKINDLAESDADKDTDPDPFDEAPEWAKALAQQVEANAEAVENIGKQAGYSQQVSGAGDGDESNGETDKSLAGILREAGVQ